MKTPKSMPSLEDLESDVLARIAAHRKTRHSTGALPIAFLVTLTALASGLLTGIADPHHKPARQESEAALLADDVSLAPSSLLASSQ